MKILNLISTKEEDVKDDVEFMEKHYPVVDQIYNQGGLTLVNERFLKWAQLLVTAINLHINESKIWQKQHNIINDGRTIIQNNITK